MVKNLQMIAEKDTSFSNEFWDTNISESSNDKTDSSKDKTDSKDKKAIEEKP